MPEVTEDIIERVAIERRRDDVWEVLADFANVAEWAPFLTQSRVITEGDVGIGSRRLIRHRWGFRLYETVNEWEEGEHMAYAVRGAPYPIEGLRESWRIAGNGNGTVVTTRVGYRVRLGSAGALLDRIVIRPMMRRTMRHGLEALKGRLERARPASQTG